jgi:hypothetical protein
MDVIIAFFYNFKIMGLIQYFVSKVNTNTIYSVYILIWITKAGFVVKFIFFSRYCNYRPV